MVFTDFFIHRPVFAWVTNIIIVLLGLTAFLQLRTRQYPATEGTVVTVRIQMDASTKIIENQITRPVEDAFSSLQGLESMESTTQKGEVELFLSFAGRSLDAASADIRDVLSRIHLPDQAHTTVTKGDTNTSAVMELVLTGKGMPLSSLYDTAEKTLKGQLESIDGVATAEVAGGSDFQMDIALDPVKMASYQISASEVVSALKRHNFQRSAGRIRESEREFSLTTQACLKTPKEFNDIVVAKHEDRLIRLSDVALCTICPGEEDVKVMYNGVQAVSISIKPQSDANPIEISKKVREKVEKLQSVLPRSVKIHVAIDKALFVKDSISQVYQSLIEAVLLVLAVIFFFLRSIRASIIPLITIPISLIGTFFMMYSLGFTINVLSLLALVLAIGLVVDDAIVVLENIYRNIEEGKSPFQAALLGAREIRFSIVAMTLTLVAVYAPIAVAPGIVGKVFKEFALTLAFAVLISGVVALTLSPTMCARLLKDHGLSKGGGNHFNNGNGGEASKGLSRWLSSVSVAIDRGFVYCEERYLKGISLAIRHKTVTMLLALIFSGLSGLLTLTIKKELSPRIDEGLLSVKFYPPPTKNLAYILKRADPIDAILKKHPEIANRLLTLQTSRESFSQSALVPWDQRDKSCPDVANSLEEDLQDIRGLAGWARCPSSSIISSRGGGTQQVLSFRLLTNQSSEELKKIGRNLQRLLKKYPGVASLDPSEIAQQPEYEITINQERMNQLGVDPEEIAQTIQTLIGGNVVGKFEKDNKMYPVRIWVNERSRKSIEDVSSLFVKGKSKQGEIIIPIREIVQFNYRLSDPTIDHHMKRRSYDIKAYLDPKADLSTVFNGFKEEIKDLLPSGYELEPSGALERYLSEKGSIYLIFGLALLFIFLVMAAQFESFRAPFVIILSVPLALGGAILALYLIRDGSLNIYSQIGLITLVGLITKHGILLVDFANNKMKEGYTSTKAIIEACKLRLRPILMTTFAMVLGAIPLATATGAGAEARRQIGTVIAGGMTLGTLFTLFALPVIYILITKKIQVPGES